MKHSNFFVPWILILLFLPLIYSCRQESGTSHDDFNALLENFQQPEKEYRTAPLWVWNDKMSREKIDFMLEDLKNKGFGGAFVHPRPGLITEYLSDEWFELFQYSVDKGRELNMNIWIYDENSYPSGFAGGHVPAQMPESYNQGQGLEMKKWETLPDTLSHFFLCLMESDGMYEDITAKTKNYTGTSGPFYVFHKTYYRKSPWFGGFSYVDLLVPGVTQKFMDITMEGYEKVAKDDFGRVVPGVFTDEPEIPTSGGIRWTPDLFEVFQEKWGYNLKLHLPSLYEEVGEWKKIRHNYIETLLQMFIDRWSKPWFEYCEKNNLAWTGHYWEHGWPNLAQGGDNMAMYAWHQMPAIDMLFNQFNETSPRAQFGNIRAVKELRSVANQMGYKRTLCETYGGGGWDVTFKDLKRLGDWTYVLGVNFMNQHLSHSTLKGARKYDYPPVFSYHSPWWPHYKPLNDYFARLSVALSMGEQKNDLLVIEPTTTLWNYYSYAKESEKLNQIGQRFQNFVTQLEKSQVEYDLASENIIKDHGRVNNGKFIIGERGYSAVVIPEFVENIEKHTFDLLAQFESRGGKIITFSSPLRMSGKENSEVTDFFKQTDSNVTKFEQLNSEIIDNWFSGKDIQFHNVNGGNLFHHRREYKDGQLILLVNSAMENAVSGTFQIIGKTVLEMDAFSGDIHQYPSTHSENKVIMDFELSPAGSLLLYISNNETDAYDAPYSYKNEQLIEPKGNLEITPLRENAMKIDFCNLVTEGKEFSNIYFSKAADIVFNQYGFQGNPWNHSVQYKRNTVERDTFKNGGFEVKYSFEVKGDVSDADMKISVERPELFNVRFNGKNLNPIPEKWFLDKSFPVYDISALVETGENLIELIVKPMSVFAEIEPVYILGNFSVLPANKGWYIDMKKPRPRLGSWGKQGLPFYSWEISYQKKYTIKDTNKRYKIKLPQWHGTVSEILVNGKSAGIIGFDPFELDISKWVKTGENNIEVQVTGSLKNLLGPHFKNPAPGLAGPGHWKNVGNDIPGMEYQMVDYGLFEDFQLIAYESL